MKTELLLEGTDIEPEQLIGTRWTAWNKLLGEQISVEFVDRTNCIYTSQPKKYPLKYTIAGGKVFISNIEGPFELRGRVLFNNDIPTFEKAALAAKLPA